MFRQCCPYFLSLGMTWDQYWFCDVTIARDFWEADRLRRQRANETAWMHGLYVYEAVSTVLSQALSKNKQTAAQYPDKPHDFFIDRKQAAMDEQQKAENERLKAILYFRNMERAARQKELEEGGKSDGGYTDRPSAN